MSDSLEAQDALSSLFNRFIEGQLTDSEHLVLSERLRNDPAARDAYAAFVVLHSMLQLEHVTPIVPLDGNQLDHEFAYADLPADKVPGSSKPSISVLGYLGGTAAALGRPVVWSVLAASLLFAGYIIAISWNMLGKQLPNGTADNDIAVAVISDMQDAKWSSSTPRGKGAPDGEKVSVNQGEPLKIDSGLIEIQLKQGTTLLIEGPADWKINGENSATLTHGKLVATVPRQAVGFTLKTPTAKIIDLGTEFGVEVSRDGAADVHVLNGLVEVQDVGGPKKKSPQRLTEGQSARVTTAGATVVEEREIADKFTRLAAETAKKKTVRGEGDRYAKCLRALKPIVYLPIDRKDGLTIADHANGKYVGEFTRTAGPGEPWETGPFGDALLFRGNQFADRVTLVPKDTDLAVPQLTFSRGKKPGLPFTIVLWARCRPNQKTGLLVGKGGGFQSQFVLDVLDGGYRFLIHNAAGKLNGLIKSQAVFDGTWQHVAAVFDPDRKSISLYVNGLLSATAPVDDVSLSPIAEPVFIGNRDFPGDPNKLSLDGALDEIAIFDRVLSDAEIQKLYRLQPID